MSQRDPRQHDPGYLAWLRKQPCCCGCGKPAPSQAAHLRQGVTGMQRKPHDRRALPLSASCHIRQHAFGDEAAWWHAHGIQPLLMADRYYAEYRRENPKAPEPFVKKRRPIKARKPREQRQKIKGRSTFR